jgi:hypothetical protein
LRLDQSFINRSEKYGSRRGARAGARVAMVEKEELKDALPGVPTFSHVTGCAIVRMSGCFEKKVSGPTSAILDVRRET